MDREMKEKTFKRRHFSNFRPIHRTSAHGRELTAFGPTRGELAEVVP